MTFEAQFELAGLPPMNRQHKHWAVLGKLNKRWRHDAYIAMRAAGLPEGELKSVRVRYTRHSTREPDLDNAAAATKAIQDGICDALRFDDKPNQFTPEWRWEKARPREGKTTIQIWGELK